MKTSSLWQIRINLTRILQLKKLCYGIVRANARRKRAGTNIYVSPLSPLETISNTLWASLYHHLPVLYVFSHVSCQFVFAHILSIHLRVGRPLLLFPGATMSIIFLDKLSSSLLLICPYRFNRFCLRNVDIWHTLASSCMLWFLTWSFLVLPLIHRSILISVTCNLILKWKEKQPI